uniref:Uncharacterized protein n=1 Tax=Arundo donax TaxID=35708 RepID=A0A0A9U2D5_ARUDO
MASTVKGVRSV